MHAATTRDSFLTLLRHQLWQPPRPHGEQAPERRIGPLELFYDLVVVVLVGQAAHHLTAYLDWHGLGEFAAVFTLVWIAWLNDTLHHEPHNREDAVARQPWSIPTRRLLTCRRASEWVHSQDRESLAGQPPEHRPLRTPIVGGTHFIAAAYPLHAFPIVPVCPSPASSVPSTQVEATTTALLPHGTQHEGPSHLLKQA